MAQNVYSSTVPSIANTLIKTTFLQVKAQAPLGNEEHRWYVVWLPQDLMCITEARTDE